MKTKTKKNQPKKKSLTRSKPIEPLEPLRTKYHWNGKYEL